MFVLMFTVPNNIKHDVSFVIDTSRLKSQSDWKCDDMGAWRNNGVRKSCFQHKNGIISAVEKDKSHCSDPTHTLVRIYFQNRTSPDLKKLVSFLEGNVKGNVLYVVDNIVENIIFNC